MIHLYNYVEKFNAMKKVISIIIIVFSLSIISQAQQNFQDVISSMGISGQTGLGLTVGWGDIDNDGDADLGISSSSEDGLWFYLNEGDHFTDITNLAGLSGLGGNKIIIAEVTGDEFNDLILRTLSGTQYLFESNGDGTFNDISIAAGISNASVYNIADFNNDGYLDLLSIAGNNYSILYNNGDATFQAAQIISPYIYFSGVAVFDYDRDGYMDIYHTTYTEAPKILLHNNGDGTFSNTTTQAGLDYSGAAHGLDVGDFNNDGWIDLYLGSYSNLGCKLFQNNGDGTFTDVSNATGTTGHNDTRTVAFVDYNNDGWLDIFSSHHDFYSYSNTMLRNNGDNTFTNVAPSLGLSGLYFGDYFGQGWADFDQDGAVDLFAGGHVDEFRLFKNIDCPGSFLNIHLVGIESNPNGIGSRVEVWVAGQKISRYVLPNGGFHDYDNLDINFGLDGAYSVDSILVYWPSGINQKLWTTNTNQSLTIVESGITSVEDTAITNQSFIPIVSPNPLSTYGAFEFYLSQPNQIRVAIFDLNGNQVKLLKYEKMISGLKIIKFDVNNLPNGVYLIKALGTNFSDISKIIVLK